VTGWKKTTSLILISITALSIPSVFLLSTPSTARAASLSHRLTLTRHRLRHARAKLSADRLAYAAALAATAGATTSAADATPAPVPSAMSDPTATATPTAASSDPNATPTPTTTPAPAASPAPSLHQLRVAMLADRRRVRALNRLAVRLRQAIVMKAAAARGDWMPIVRDAARHSHISATGLRRMMSLESGGRVHAENGSFHGLYQYCWSTWRAAWNPWRHSSLYDGAAQIRATAVAIHRGWGAQMWPNTYPRAF
jgi:hypothetical protein